MHGKTAIGGANDGWLRLNPFDAFTTGIYTGNGIIRHGGTSIQLGSLGDAQATTLYRPNDVAWSLTTGGYAAVSVKQQTSSSAHWLLGSYKSSFEGDMRAGIQVLSNDSAHMRLYTNMRTHYAEIRDGNILVSGAQSSYGSSLTRKDYVDSQDALKLNKAGDTMTGVLNVPRIKITAADAGLNNPSDKNIIRFGGSGNDTVIGNPDGATYIDIKGVSVYVREDGLSTKQHKVYHEGFKPTAGDVGAVNKSGDSMIGQLTLTPGFVDTSVNAQLAHIGKDATKPLYIRNMREHNSSAWLWEKVYDGSLYYSSGTNGSGTSKIRLQVSSSGEIYLGANADKRVYHEGFKPTPAAVGAVNKTGDTMTGNLTAPAVLVSSAQNTSVNALTRKDYVDAEVAKLLARITALESK